MVEKFSRIWEKYSGIQFKFTNSVYIPEPYEKYYKVTFKGKSNHSNIGAVNGTVQLGNLVQNEIESMEIIQHEFGHVLGLSHEHQRRDRPQTLNSHDLLKACKLRQNQSRKWCEDNFGKISSGVVFVESGYDFLSIMHYDLSSISDDQELLANIPGGDKLGLSLTDKLYMALLYNPGLLESDVNDMHRQDLLNQDKFIKEAKQRNRQKILSLHTQSCKVLAAGEISEDGHFCKTGYLVIGSDNYAFPLKEKKQISCVSSYEAVEDSISQNQYCGISKERLSDFRAQWNKEMEKFGNCKRLETNVKNNQGYMCKEGVSYVTADNDMIGHRTGCFVSASMAFEEMRRNEVCNMRPARFKEYKEEQRRQLLKQMQTSQCQVLNESEAGVNCPEGFPYIVFKKGLNQPANQSCYENVYQAIMEMNKVSLCK